MRHLITCAVLSCGIATGGTFAQGDPEITNRIIQEGTQNSQVWDYLVHLSEEIGPRLTGSTSLDRANAWTRDQFAALGLYNAHLRKWGEVPVRFDRGPSTARMIEPMEREFEFTASSWSAGTMGPVRGAVVKAPTTLEELDEIRDDVGGKWVLSQQPRRRGRRRRGGDEGGGDDARQVREAIDLALREAGIAGRIYGTRSDIVITSSVRGWRDLSFDDLPTDVSVTVRRSDYDAMNSRLADGESVEVEIDLQHHFSEGPFPVFNTIAEIRGTEFPDEVVILSGHLDSWDGPGTEGAQDNATGCAVALEAARLLMESGARPRRTIRFILWTGEEQGLLGSRAYVESLSDEERAGISAVFVEDGGSNYQGGLQCIESMVPMLDQATAAVNAAFPDMPVVLAVRDRMPRGGGSDHSPFNRVGIPGFFWTEEGIGGREGKDYSFIHHTQHDTVRYAVPEYMVQSAVCSALTVYNLAMADSLLPRQPTDEPQVAEGRRRGEAPSAAQGQPWTTAVGPLTGKWTARLTGEFAPPGSEFTLVLEMSSDGRVRGTFKSEISDGTLDDVAWDAAASKLTFTRDSEQMGRIEFAATVEGDRMTGTVTVNEFSLPFKGERISAGEVIAEAASAGGAVDESDDEEDQDHEHDH